MRPRRTDANHSEVIEALRSAGAIVEDTHDLPGFFDAVVGHPGTKKVGLVEIKDGEKPPSQRKLTKDQIELWDRWQGFPLGLVTDCESALRFYKMLGYENPDAEIRQGAISDGVLPASGGREECATGSQSAPQNRNT